MGMSVIAKTFNTLANSSADSVVDHRGHGETCDNTCDKTYDKTHDEIFANKHPRVFDQIPRLLSHKIMSSIYVVDYVVQFESYVVALLSAIMSSFLSSVIMSSVFVVATYVVNLCRRFMSSTYVANSETYGAESISRV